MKTHVSVRPAGPDMHDSGETPPPTATFEDLSRNFRDGYALRSATLTFAGLTPIAWTVFLEHAEPGCSVISLEPDEPWGWHLTLSFGERVSVSLGSDGKPEFYFVSW